MQFVNIFYYAVTAFTNTTKISLLLLQVMTKLSLTGQRKPKKVQLNVNKLSFVSVEWLLMKVFCVTIYANKLFFVLRQRLTIKYTQLIVNIGYNLV